MVLSSFLATVMGSFIFYQSLHGIAEKSADVRKRMYFVHACAIIFYLSTLVLFSTRSILLAITIPLFVMYLPLWAARLPSANFLDRAELLIITLLVALTSCTVAHYGTVTVIGFVEACLLLSQLMVTMSQDRRRKRK